MTFCNTPELAAEATLQPVRRFALDAAIVFSDILIVPHAMGRHVDFVDGHGPRLEPLAGVAEMVSLDAERAVEGNEALMETLRLVAGSLGEETALIGFAGAPFTLAAYMIDGRSGRFARTRALMRDRPGLLDVLISRLTLAVTSLLIAQIDAGAQAVQIFDSWSGMLANDRAFARAGRPSPPPGLPGGSRAPGPAFRSSGFPGAPASATAPMPSRAASMRSRSTSTCR